MNEEVFERLKGLAKERKSCVKINKKNMLKLQELSTLNHSLHHHHYFFLKRVQMG
jgi:hypothetical protein